MSRTHKLNKYIEANWEWSPEDIMHYSDGGHKTELCPLCDEPHKNYRLTEFSVYDEDIIKPKTLLYTVDACMCADCHFEAKIHLEEDESFETKDELSLRLDHYLKYQELPEDYDMYLSGVGSCAHLCFFCMDEWHPEMYRSLQLPVGKDKKWNGGYVNICKKCNSDIGGEEIHWKSTDACCNSHCMLSYAITQEEDIARTESRSRGMHCCPRPSCWVDPTQERFEHGNCESCMKELIVDRSIPMRLNSQVNSFNHLTCRTCNNKAVETKLLPAIEEQFATTYYHNITSTTRIIIFAAIPYKNKWRFKIQSCNKFTTKWIDMIDPRKTTNHIADAVVYGLQIYKDYTGDRTRQSEYKPQLELQL